jgi:RNA polymerase sigma-70 factor (ECF subfamily)
MPQLEQQAVDVKPMKAEPIDIEVESPIAILYRCHAPTILAYVRKHVPCSEDAEDVLLDVFLAALEHDSVFLHLEERQQLAWLRRAAHNKFIDYHRRSRRRPAVSLEMTTEALFDDDEQAPEQVALRHEEYALLRERLACLPDQQQEVLQLRFAADMRCIDIALLLDRREGTVRAWLSRSLNFLRTFYEN